MGDDIKYDPIEDTEKYKKIKDELEEKIKIRIEKEGINKGLGYCHIYWEFKKMILKEEYNMDWNSPTEMNPGIIFD